MDVLTIIPGKRAKLSDAIRYLRRKNYTEIHCSFCRVDLSTEVGYGKGTFVSYRPATAAGPPRMDKTEWSDVRAGKV
jgi:hypothetical protein